MDIFIILRKGCLFSLRERGICPSLILIQHYGELFMHYNKKKIFGSIYMIIITMIMMSCSKPDVLLPETLIYETNDQTETVSVQEESEKQYEPEYFENIENVMNELAQEDFYTGNNLFGRSNSAFVNGSLFIMPTYSQMVKYNISDNSWKMYCTDPLCTHKDDSCLDNKLMISAITTDGDNLYIKGTEVTENKILNKDIATTFIGKMDYASSSYIIYDELPSFNGSDSLSFIYHENSLFYTVKSSEETNNVWQYNLQTKEITQITDQEKIIVQFQVDNNKIYYRDNTYDCYVYDISNNETTYLLDRVSTVGIYSDMIYYIRMFSDAGDGFDVYSAHLNDPRNMKKIINSIYAPIDVTIINDIMYYTTWNEISNGMIEIGNNVYEDVTFNGYELYCYNLKTEEIQVIEFDPQYTCGIGKIYGMWGDKILLDTRSVLGETCFYLLGDEEYIRVN